MNRRGGLHWEELGSLKVKDLQSRQSVIHFKVKGKRGKIRFVPAHAQAQRLIESYLLLVGHGDDKDGPLFRPVRNNRTGELERPLNPNSLYRNIIRKYGQETGLNIEVNGLCVHRCGRQPPPMRSPMKPILPRCRSGWAMPTSLPSASTIGGKQGQKTVQHFEFGTELLHQVVEKMQTARLECQMPCRCA